MSIRNFIKDMSFPCIMAKAVEKKGYLKEYEYQGREELFLQEINSFIKHFRRNSKKLHSFILHFPDQTGNFLNFEDFFWNFILRIREIDRCKFSYAPKVSSQLDNDNYAFSLFEEAFFLVALHPNSPRLARRYKHPAIVFNPHKQFEDLKRKGIYSKIKNLIRKRDKKLQGSENPMLQDHGLSSPIFQYTGRDYRGKEKILLKSLKELEHG